MTTLYHTINTGLHENRSTSKTIGVRLITSKNRNLSISKLQQKSIDIQNVKLTINPLKNSQSLNSVNQKEFKKYCLNKLKNNHQSQKNIALRKNRSLKSIKKEQSTKYFNRTKIDPLNQEISNGKKQAKYLQECTQKIKGISIKRRVQLIKKNHTKLKIIQKETNNKAEEKKSQISFQHKYTSDCSEFEKLISTNKIQSQNILGQGLKKSSSSKMKVLVKNPFDKLMKVQQLKQALNKPVSLIQTSSLEQIMHESKIVQNLEQSATSISNRIELQQMLALM